MRFARCSSQSVGHQDRLHELLGHADVEERPRLLALAQLDQALALVEGDVGERADRDRQGRITPRCAASMTTSATPTSFFSTPLTFRDFVAIAVSLRAPARRRRLRSVGGASLLGLCARPARASVRPRFSCGPSRRGGPSRPLGIPAARSSAAGWPFPLADATVTGGAITAGTSPSTPSAVTMIECGRPSGA